ncbi:MAG: hypothetical protein KatS3mg091_836 [Patescibacteria group bacterium]|nr:MAG: hypothetical protein KatS3mg091_836 [Patescibacteria group bacterium]
MKLIRIFCLTTILIYALFIPKVLAKDNKLVCSDNDCSNNNLSLFSNSTNWYPGKWETDYLEIENKGKLPIVVLFSSFNNAIDASECKLDEKLQIIISQLSQKGLNQIIWGGSLVNFKNTKIIRSKEISGNQTEKFRFLISLDQQTGNECQKAKTNLNLQLQITSENSNQYNTCTETKPKPPILESANWVNNEYIKLKWKTADEQSNYFVIKYLDQFDKEVIISNAGTKTAREFIFFPTSKTNTYKFTIIGGNDCALSDESNPIIINPKPSTIKNTNQIQNNTKPIIEQTSDIINNNKDIQETNKDLATITIKKTTNKSQKTKNELKTNRNSNNKTENKTINEYVKQAQIIATDITAKTVKTVVSILQPIVIIVVSVVSSIISIFR